MATLPPDNSIYDFIYLDLPRIRSYYAQMTGGVPVTSNDNSKESESTTWGATAGPRDMMHGKYDHVGSSEESLGVTSDMIDKLPRDMINALNDRKLIHSALGDGNLGKLVLLKGYLQFNDLHAVSKSLQPTIDFYMNHIASKDEKREFLPVQKGLKEFANVLAVSPSRVQCYMTLESQLQNSFVWIGIDDRYLEVSQAYSALKNHSCSAEMFYVLGILDALPVAAENQEAKDRFDDFNQKLLEAADFNMFLKSMNEIYRKIIGRPETCYSITPISIFRALGVASE